MKQIFIMLVGFSQSGKTILSKKILKAFANQFVRIDSNAIHDFLNKTYSIFRDDNTIKGKSYKLRQKTTKVIHDALIKVLLQNRFSIILDSCNLTRERREKIINSVKRVNKDIKTVIIYNKISESQLYKNLRKADQRLIRKRKEPVWVDLYEKVQKPKLEEPKRSEADYFFKHTRENPNNIIKQLKVIIRR